MCIPCVQDSPLSLQAPGTACFSTYLDLPSASLGESKRNPAKQHLCELFTRVWVRTGGRGSLHRWKAALASYSLSSCLLWDSSELRSGVNSHWHGLGHVDKARKVAEEAPGWNWLKYKEGKLLWWRQGRQAHLTLLWSNTALWNADVSGRPSFPDLEVTRDYTQTLEQKVSAAARPRLTSSLALCVLEPVTHFSVGPLPI